MSSVKMSIICKTVAISLVFLTSTQIAHAGAVRTFIATFGSDANSGTFCQAAAPCRTFATAIGATNAGGEIVAMDSGSFGSFSVTQAMTILGAPGIHAGVGVVLGGTAITVNAGASDKIVIRNLRLNGTPGGVNGVGIQLTGGVLVVENTEITRFGKGVYVTAGSADLRDVQLIANTVAVRADGQGPDQDANTGGITPRVSIVRVSRSTIVDNATAFYMNNPGVNVGGENQVGNPPPGSVGGTRSQGSNNAQNIFLNNEGNTNTPNSYIAGNTTFLTITGTGEFNGATASTTPQMGFFASQSQNYTSVANQ